MGKYISFDLDGTLVDADEMHYVALNRALEPHGTIITPAEHTATFKGLPTTKKLAMLVERERIKPEDVPVIAALKQAATLKAIEDTVWPDRHVQALIGLLNRLGWSMCCCSNAVRESVVAMLRKSDLHLYMAFVLSNEDADPKPSPAIYLKAAALFSIAPNQLVVVEDAAPGKAAARAAGCPLVEVASPADCTPKLLPAIYRAAGVNGETSPRPWAFREESTR
jgi:HAD superfamily hydrolase (TIGR01509 family)